MYDLPKLIAKTQSLPHFDERFVAGVDEAGRGALAGPVVAAAVILNPHLEIENCIDSKKLSAVQRERTAEDIKRKALAWHVASASHHEIIHFNILQATLLAMARAVAGLQLSPQQVFVDGNRCPLIKSPCTAIIGGDQRLRCIAAASILAKTTRDDYMRDVDARYPVYQFASHKGYATRKHIASLAKYGSCPIHRTSWAKVRQFARCSDYRNTEMTLGYE